VEERIFMTNLKGKLPSPKGLIRKIFKNGKVIGLLLAILISIFSVFIIRTCIDIKTENANVVVQAKGISLEKQVLDDHVKTIEAKGYENVTYELNKIVETAEKNNVPRRNVNVTSRGNIEDRIKEAIVSRYDFYATYYKVQIDGNDYLFKNNSECEDFIHKINEYDSQEYTIETTKKIIYQETKEEDLSNIINTKKEAYEAEQARLRAKAEAKERARKAAEEKARREKEQSTTTAQSSSSGSYSLSDYQAYAKDLVINTYGWSEYDFECLVKLWNRESGWNPNSHNSSSGAHGIPQSLPASKMASEGADYYTNGYTQIRWGLKYIKGRYGSPSAAWAHSQSKGWY
jgi:hypothetical protein